MLLTTVPLGLLRRPESAGGCGRGDREREPRERDDDDGNALHDRPPSVVTARTPRPPRHAARMAVMTRVPGDPAARATGARATRSMTTGMSQARRRSPQLRECAIVISAAFRKPWPCTPACSLRAEGRYEEIPSGSLGLTGVVQPMAVRLASPKGARRPSVPVDAGQNARLTHTETGKRPSISTHLRSATRREFIGRGRPTDRDRPPGGGQVRDPGLSRSADRAARLRPFVPRRSDPAGEPGAGADAELAIDACEVCIHGLGAHEGSPGYLKVRQPSGGELYHSHFRRGQLVRCAANRAWPRRHGGCPQCL